MREEEKPSVLVACAAIFFMLAIGGACTFLALEVSKAIGGNTVIYIVAMVMFAITVAAWRKR